MQKDGRDELGRDGRVATKNGEMQPHPLRSSVVGHSAQVDTKW
jgi:hypothetical protein